MTTALLFAVAVLWLVVLALSAVVFVMLRQILPSASVCSARIPGCTQVCTT